MRNSFGRFIAIVAALAAFSVVSVVIVDAREPVETQKLVLDAMPGFRC